jgi:predicted MPP superfamily phosphohydrolase
MDLQLAERPRRREAPPTTEPLLETMESRLGPLHARQRLGIEKDLEARASRQGLNVFRLENRFLSPAIIRRALKLTGLYWRARRNAENIQIRQYDIRVRQLPAAFDGFTILQLSDLHVDMSAGAMRRLIELLPTVSYDLCVLTGDYRGKTFGPFEPAIEGLARMRAHLSGPVYGVLGNHDTIRMVPALEAMGIRMLLNESEILERSGERIYLGGIDDAHYYRLDNIEKTALQIPAAEFAILLSHTPEIYRQAAHAGFDVLLSGHTHGGQICLPGAIPITLDSVLPRRMGSGAWRYHDMFGYTSVGVGSSLLPARLNCLPEITLHCLRCEPARLQYGRSRR